MNLSSKKSNHKPKKHKKLLFFALALGLFAGCKKTEPAPDTCYVGVWGNNQVFCPELPFPRPALSILGLFFQQAEMSEA